MLGQQASGAEAIVYTGTGFSDLPETAKPGEKALITFPGNVRLGFTFSLSKAWELTDILDKKLVDVAIAWLPHSTPVQHLELLTKAQNVPQGACATLMINESEAVTFMYHDGHWNPAIRPPTQGASDDHAIDAVEASRRQKMIALMETVDDFLNDGATGLNRQTGVILITFPFGIDDLKTANYMSNGADRAEAIKVLEHLVTRLKNEAAEAERLAAEAEKARQH